MRLPQHKGRTDWAGIGMMALCAAAVLGGSAWLLGWVQ